MYQFHFNASAVEIAVISDKVGFDIDRIVIGDCRFDTNITDSVIFFAIY